MKTVKKLTVTDTTLRELAARHDMSLTFRESLEAAKALERLHVDVIGLPALANAKADTLLVRTIAAAVKDCVLSLPVGYTAESVEAAWNALSGAEKPQLCVSLPVSTVQMEYICHMKAPKLLEAVKTLVTAAREKCENVVFWAEDATRADREFLKTVISAAVQAGAAGVAVQDSTGALLPEELADWVSELKTVLPADMPFTVQCTDELSLAAASTLAAVRAGADGVAVVADGKSAASLLAIAQIAAAKGADCGFTCSLSVTELHRGMQQLYRVLGIGNQAAAAPTPAGESREREAIRLTAQSDRAAVDAAVKTLGYELSMDDMAQVYDEVCRVAAKKAVNARELEAIVATTAMQVPPTFTLVSFVINSGNQISATAHVKFEKNGKTVEGVSLGDGPIDAAFLAIERIVGRHYELDDFQIQSVTQGREAVGSALVKLREGGRLYSGTGVSTDIIGASIRAYVNALNKIAYDAR